MEVSVTGATRTVNCYITIGSTQVGTKTVVGGSPSYAWACGNMQNTNVCQTAVYTTAISPVIPARKRYTPYGGDRNAVTFTNTDRGFLNQPEDTTGLTFLNNRYHDPTLAHFTTVDPLVGQTGQPYLYGDGTPATLTDPSGLDPGWAHDTDLCNDAGWYKCSTPKGGPNRGKDIVTGPGRRQCDETYHLAPGCAPLTGPHLPDGGHSSPDPKDPEADSSPTTPVLPGKGVVADANGNLLTLVTDSALALEIGMTLCASIEGKNVCGTVSNISKAGTVFALGDVAYTCNTGSDSDCSLSVVSFIAESIVGRLTGPVTFIVLELAVTLVGNFIYELQQENVGNTCTFDQYMTIKNNEGSYPGGNKHSPYMDEAGVTLFC